MRFTLLILTALLGCEAPDDPTAADAGLEAGEADATVSPDLMAPVADIAQPPDVPSLPGTAVLRFAATEGVHANPTLVDALRGRVIGNIFLAADVGLMGPKDDAPVFGSIDLADVDLTVPDARSEAVTLELQPAEYMFLGMMDLDGNAEASGLSPDPGDLATLPLHKFEVRSDEIVEAVIAFDLVYN